MKAVLQYVPGSSFFHVIHPVTKIIWAFFTGILCFICQNIWFLAVVALINLIIFFIGGIAREGRPVLKMFGIISFLILFFTVFFNREGGAVFEYGIIMITKAGIIQGFVMVFRMLGALLPISILIMVTPTNDLSLAFVRYFRVPYKYAFAVTATLRFIPMLTGEMEQIIQAQTARGCDLDRGGPIKKFGRIVPLSVPLLASSVKKTEHMAISLEVRGFGAEQRSSYHKMSFGIRDAVVFTVLTAGYAAGIFITFFLD
ncbi:MAG: energy-coupling factor transporter transmembrane protein EcfT [Oscillospiraceae bacterium]|nr:energy-coupling factor transporter transmembrane protein EcfT [Oscillospiraceae bacterium]